MKRISLLLCVALLAMSLAGCKKETFEEETFEKETLEEETLEEETFYISDQNNLVITQDALDKLPEKEQVKWRVHEGTIYKHEARSAHLSEPVIEYSTDPELKMYEYAAGTEDGVITEYCVYSVSLPVGFEYPPNPELVILEVKELETIHTKI